MPHTTNTPPATPKKTKRSGPVPSLNFAGFGLMTPPTSPRNDETRSLNPLVTRRNQDQNVAQDTEDNNITPEIITLSDGAGFTTPRNTETLVTPRNEATSSSSDEITTPRNGLVTPRNSITSEENIIDISKSKYYLPAKNEEDDDAASEIHPISLNNIEEHTPVEQLEPTISLTRKFASPELKNLYLDINHMDNSYEKLGHLKEFVETNYYHPTEGFGPLGALSCYTKQVEGFKKYIKNIKNDVSDFSLIKQAKTLKSDLHFFYQNSHSVYIISGLCDDVRGHILSFIYPIANEGGLMAPEWAPNRRVPTFLEFINHYTRVIADARNSVYHIEGTSSNEDGISTERQSEDTCSESRSNTTESSSSNDALSQNTASTLDNNKESTLAAQVQDKSESYERNINLPNIAANTEVSKEILIKGYDEDSYYDTTVDVLSAAKANCTIGSYGDIFENHAAARVGFIGFASGFLGDLQGDIEALVM